MANVTVYFATNRVAQGSSTDWHSYGRADVAAAMRKAPNLHGGLIQL
jgi:hypothetical protein